MIQQGVDKITDTVETFFEDDIFSKVQTYLTSITSGVIYGVKFVLNVIVGLIISVYVMADQEHFAGQALILSVRAMRFSVDLSVVKY